MTSLAFILGVLPLVMARGAGAEMRRTLGTAVFSGMLGVTLFGIVLTPVFFFTIDWLAESRMFASRLLRGVGDTLLSLLTLRPLRVTGALLAKRARVRFQHNGHGNGHADPHVIAERLPVPSTERSTEPAKRQ